ncbi:MAG: hypothetical protein COT73_04000 [Bdellovibrio sp. CG10_big_fil_rev_8_21_14_0_10_47_8]|nr:MAG: hypothetical protein COT73_04000 [Bdellovibrio sp. CG10_big_fil_rev_8_21_14_0_10_47_8]
MSRILCSLFLSNLCFPLTALAQVPRNSDVRFEPNIPVNCALDHLYVAKIYDYIQIRSENLMVAHFKVFHASCSQGHFKFREVLNQPAYAIDIIREFSSLSQNEAVGDFVSVGAEMVDEYQVEVNVLIDLRKLYGNTPVALRRTEKLGLLFTPGNDLRYKFDLTLVPRQASGTDANSGMASGFDLRLNPNADVTIDYPTNW